MDTIYTANDYKILKAIIDRNNEKKGLCKGDGTTVKELIEKTSLSDKKIRLTLKKFEEDNFVCKGLRITKADTYLLTPTGFNELNSLRLNIFGEVK